MNEDQFVEHLKELLGQDVKKISDVDWSTVSQEALDTNSFAHGNPFYLVAPEDYWMEMRETPLYHARCNCMDVNGNPIPNCTPAQPYTPLATSICIDIANPKNYNDTVGRTCMRQGDTWYQLSCFCPCL